MGRGCDRLCHEQALQPSPLEIQGGPVKVWLVFTEFQADTPAIDGVFASVESLLARLSFLPELLHGFIPQQLDGFTERVLQVFTYAKSVLVRVFIETVK